MALATDDIKYKSYGGGYGGYGGGSRSARRSRDRDPFGLSSYGSSASYLSGLDTRHRYSLGLGGRSSSSKYSR